MLERADSRRSLQFQKCGLNSNPAARTDAMRRRGGATELRSVSTEQDAPEARAYYRHPAVQNTVSLRDERGGRLA